MAPIRTGAGRAVRRLALRLNLALLGLAAAALVAVAASSDRAATPAPALAASAAADPSVAGQWGSLMSWPLVAVHSSLLDNGNVVARRPSGSGTRPPARSRPPPTRRRRSSAPPSCSCPTAA